MYGLCCSCAEHPLRISSQVYTLLDDYSSAINVYCEALEHSPENSEILTTLGLLFLRCEPGCVGAPQAQGFY